MKLTFRDAAAAWMQARVRTREIRKRLAAIDCDAVVTMGSHGTCWQRKQRADALGLAHKGICAGCHTYTGRMIGPPVQIIQALYMNNPEGLVEYISNPVKKRDDYPEMPRQDYLDAETRLAVAEYMLSVKK